LAEHGLRNATVPDRVGGRYVLRGEIGRGGMATVQRAHDEVLDRPVAVKLLHAHLATDPAFLERFRREARAAAALSHPNVVAVHDWGESAEGPFLVLQLVDGPSLREVLRARGHLSPQEALTVLLPAAAGLAAAHTAGLVHRDVKPENLLIGRDGGVRVTDFGLARAAASATSTFGADVLVGSPHYLSPEAVRGEPLDPRADVYALGVVLFECLTGRRPHQGDSPFATAVAHTARPVPPPSTVMAGLPAALDEVVGVATARDRNGRFPDTDAFATALAAAVPGGGVPLTIDVDAWPADAPDGSPPRHGTLVVEPDDLHTERVGGPPPPRPFPPPPPPPATPRPAAVARGSDGATRARRDSSNGGRQYGRGWLLFLLIVTLVGGSALGGYLLWDRVLAPVTPIPDVVGSASDAAVDALRVAGFEVEVAAEREFDLDVPEAHVLSQSPMGSARLGRSITLVLSAGPKQIEVPDVAGDPADDAVDTLQAAGLDSAVAEAYHDEVPEGTVVSSDPEAAAVVDEASTVELVVSRGPEPIPVPTVVGSSSDEAAATLDDLDLDIEVAGSRHDEEAPAGTVLSQDPQPEATLFRGQAVRVVVSDGPEPIEVPNVRGQRLEDAQAEMAQRGFDVEVERRGGFGAFLNPGRVYDQDPAPGAARHRGDTILLYAYED